jgi:hypothetical protein
LLLPALRRWPVVDILLIAASVVFFAAAGTYAAALDRL